MRQIIKLYLTYISFSLILTLMLMIPSMTDHTLNDTGYANRQVTIYPYKTFHKTCQLKHCSKDSLSRFYMNNCNLYQKK